MLDFRLSFPGVMVLLFNIRGKLFSNSRLRSATLDSVAAEVVHQRMAVPTGMSIGITLSCYLRSVAT